MGEISKYDIKDDVSTIKKFGYKTDKRRKYTGTNPAGIPTYSRSITRIRDKDTGQQAEIRRSTRYAGKESGSKRSKMTFDGPRHMMTKKMKDKLKIKPEKKK